LEYKIKNDKLFDSIIQSHLKTESIRELSKKIEELEEIYQYFSKEWIIQNHYTVFEGQLRKIMEYIEQNRKLIFNVEAICYDYVLDYDKTRKNELIDAVSELLSIYENDGSISFINRLKLPSMLKNLEGVRLNGREFTKANCSKENLIVVKNLLSYYLLVDKVKFKLAQILKIDLFERLGIEENVFGRYIEQVNGILLKLINFREETKKIDSEFANIIQPKLFPVHYLDDSNEFITSVISDLNYYVVDCFNTKRTKEFISEIREFYQDFSLQNLDRYLISIEQNNLEDYVKSRVELLHEIDIIEKYQALKKIHAMFMLDKHKFIHDYIYEYDLEKRKFVVENIDSILKYHYVLNFYLEKEKANKGLPELFEKREELVLQEKKLVSNLVAVKGWYFQSKGMKPHISASLSKWMSLKKKLGAMTGKNTNLYLRQMREEMQVAKDAIPVWIMPIDKLIEQYPFENDPPFDVLIMDESSQSSIFSISALTRAKKIIIVGDDKQISPTLAFTKTDEINDLRMKYLRDNSWNLQIAKDTSIYEIVQTVCGNKKITLTEHFRCLPEIIHYSNKEFYQMAINPLKVRSRENTIELPIRTVYVPDGRCKKTGGQPYNETEIAKIVDLILEIVHDKQYDGKTIGVIALQNSTRYIQKITELLMKKFGEKLIHERSIKVGNTYDFQGDERDVIILSMIISPECRTSCIIWNRYCNTCFIFNSSHTV